MEFVERKYQSDALDAASDSYNKGTRRMILSMATGTGKSYVFSKLYERMKDRLPGRMLVIAHTEELVKQNAATLKAVNPEATVGIEQGETQSSPDCSIISASIASLNRGKRMERMTGIDKIVIDEAHHSVADSYLSCLNELNAFDKSKMVVGMTATPTRADGRALGEVYESVPYVYTLRQAIADGYLVDMEGWTIRTGLDLTEVKRTSSGDFNQQALGEAINKDIRNSQIVEAWRRLGGNGKTIVFTATVEHAQRLADTFKAAEIGAFAIWGDDPNREEKIAQHKAGLWPVLVNVGILVEGYDDPGIQVVVLARPTVSPVLFSQMVGRVTRKSEGKERGTVIDVVDSIGKNSLITLPTLFGMPWNLNLQGHGVYESILKVEAAQADNAGVDITGLENIDELQIFVEKAMMFETRFPKEVEQNSDLMWHRSIEGGFRINIPAHEKMNVDPNVETRVKKGYVRIFQNMLDKWEIQGRIGEGKFHGFRNSFEEAIKVSDEQIMKRSGEVMKLLRRSEKWHKEKSSVGQRSLWKRIMGGRPFPEEANKGQVSKMLDERLRILGERRKKK